MPDAIDLDIQNIVLSAYDADGHMSCQPDAYGEADASCASYWALFPLGLIARPLDPGLDGNGQADPTQSSVALVGTQGPKGFIWPLQDTRAMPTAPQLQKGEVAILGAKWGNFARCHADGTISLVTTTKPVSQGPSAATYLTIGADGSLEFASQYGRLLFGSSGFHVKHTSGARLDMGALGGFPAPLSAVASHFSVQAGMASIDASVVATGPSAAPSSGAPALATPTLALVAALQVFVVQLVAALAAGTVTAPVAAALAPAVAQLAVAISAANATIPAQGTSS